MKSWTIYQESAKPERAFGIYVRPRRVTSAFGDGQVDALMQFEFERYLTTGLNSYAGSRLQWRVERNLKSEWRDWDGESDPGTKGREWRLVVRLRNGRQEHDAFFLAWRDR